MVLYEVVRKITMVFFVTVFSQDTRMDNNLNTWPMDRLWFFLQQYCQLFQKKLKNYIYLFLIFLTLYMFFNVNIWWNQQKCRSKIMGYAYSNSAGPFRGVFRNLPNTYDGRFCEKVDGFLTLITFANRSILHAWQGSEYNYGKGQLHQIWSHWKFLEIWKVFIASIKIYSIIVFINSIFSDFHLISADISKKTIKVTFKTALRTAYHKVFPNWWWLESLKVK